MFLISLTIYKFRVMLDSCFFVELKIVHSRPLHRAVSHADWRGAAKRTDDQPLSHQIEKTCSGKHLTFVGNAVVVVVGVGCKYRVQFMKKPWWIAILVVP